MSDATPRTFPTRPIVLKVGGRELLPGPTLDALARLVAELESRGRRVVLVHGGGEEVTERASALGLPTERAAGQRVTSAPMLEVVIEVLAGRVSTRLVSALGAAGVAAVGVSGVGGRLLTVRPAGEPAGALGLVGVPDAVHPAPLAALLTSGITPVVAPIGIDADGQPRNVNADLAAGAIAAALGAELWLITDVPGVRDGRGILCPHLTIAQARALCAAGAATDGMVPKLQAAGSALADGVPRAWIGSLEALSPDGPAPGHGTMLVPGRAGRSGPSPLLPTPPLAGRRR